MKKLLTTLTLLLVFLAAAAGEKPRVYMQADLTSAYLWRGEKLAGVSIQPVLGVKWHGINFYAWGNEQLCPPAGVPNKHEIDFFLKYNVTPAFIVGFKDVYVNTRGKGFFSFGSIPHAANGLDVVLDYDFRFLSAEWTTAIAGYDGYNHHGKRAYSSYLTITAPFSFGSINWNAQLGIVPYYCSRYSDDHASGFHVNMCALKASHTFSFSRSDMSLTPYMQLMVNPSSRNAFFQVGTRFYFSPAPKN